jgi:lysozyme family protein
VTAASASGGAITLERLVDDVFRKEGDTYGDETTVPPIDQPTGRGGITLEALTAYRGWPCTVEDLKALSHAEARDVVRWLLLRLLNEARLSEIPFEPLRVQMVDFAYNSGPALAYRWLQRVLRVPRTGRLDDATISALYGSSLWLVHQALIAARLQMIDRATVGGAIDKKYEEGLENRALTFSLLDVP